MRTILLKLLLILLLFCSHWVYGQSFEKMIEIYDAQGNLMHAKESVNADQVNIMGSVLSTTGFYFYRIHADGELYREKLLKE
jgi:hypothetical protein